MIYSCFKCCFTKSKSRFCFLPQYAEPLLDNLIKVLSPPLKRKSTISESLDFSLSWGSFVYNAEKSYFAIDLTRIVIYVI